jgi:hypothetical protein
VPEGATEEELQLLNRFIEVAACNFDGKQLSSESEAKVRSAALKVGLSEKFVDQLLNQAQARNEKKRSHKAPLSTVGGEYGRYQRPDSPHTPGGAETIYTVDLTKATKRRKTATDATVVGCPSLWESLTKNVKNWANCGDDGSSISTVPSVSWEDDRVRIPNMPGTPGSVRNIRALV